MKEDRQKFIYIVRGKEKESYEMFKERIFLLLKEVLGTKKVHSLKVTLTVNPPPKTSIIPFKKDKIAVISAIQNDKNYLSVFRSMEGYEGSYTVEEAVPVSYDKNWEDEIQTPGICLLTLFNKKVGLDRDVFLDIWHNSHTPLSLKVHPLWNYNRNVVEEYGKENKVNWDGIVEEQFKTRQDLLNPLLFFGNILKIIPNMIKVYLDTKSFLDYKTIEPYLAHEYHIKHGS